VKRAGYTGRVMPRDYRRLWPTAPTSPARALVPVLLPALLLTVSITCLAEPAGVTIDPALTRGPAAAPVTIVEFGDFQCPICRGAQPVLDQLLKEYRGKVRLVFKDFPLTSHPGARPAAEAARCAAAHGLFWEYHDLLFLPGTEFSREALIRYAGRLALDREAFAACLDSRRFRDEIDADVREGRALGVFGTPTFIINGKPLVGAQPIEAFREAVAEALRSGGK
jgi:protein-disulfide isomerase